METNAIRAGFVEGAVRFEEAFQCLEKSSNPTALYTLERGDLVLAGARYDVDPSIGKGFWELLRLGQDLFVVVTSVQYNHRVSIPVLGEDFIEFHFRLSGRLQLIDSLNETDVSTGSLLIWRQPEGCDIIEHLNVDGQRESSVTIYCRPDFLKRYFGDYAADLDPELTEALAPVCERIRSLKAALYPGLTKLVMDLASPKLRNGIRLACAEALVVQIIGEILTNVQVQKRSQIEGAQVSDRDIDCLRQAKEILVREYAPAPTIEELGRRVGLSPTKLKTCFRTLYGQTISEFSNALRMDAARDLLRKRDIPIAHVSAELGYEYQNSFTVAFRRQYGILPKDYRRDPLAYDEYGHAV